MLEPTLVFSSEDRQVSSSIALVGAAAGVVVAIVKLFLSVVAAEKVEDRRG
jgi:hypothetical protein